MSREVGNLISVGEKNHLTTMFVPSAVQRRGHTLVGFDIELCLADGVQQKQQRMRSDRNVRNISLRST